MAIAAIETRYAGCRFRSRLEARWAVFFDALDIAWEYEPQGYIIGPQEDRRAYLPDFWLPGQGIWVEVKGDQASADLRTLAYAANKNYGLPKATSCPRMLLLGNVPRVDPKWLAWHAALSFYKGDLFQGGAYFAGNGLRFFGDELLLGSDADHFEQMNTGPSFWRFDAYVDHENWTGIPSPSHAYAAARSARFEHGERGR